MSERVDLQVDGRRLDIELAWVGEAGRPVLVFLHEGLGSLAMWKDFPARLCTAAGWRGLVYSRPGYGQSTPRPPAERWAPDFMHRQAQALLPALLDRLGVREPCALFGHSDGGSIALIHAALFPERVSGAVVLAPHITVERKAVDSIRRTRDDYLHGGLKARLARHHADVDSAFFGWNDIWLDPAFEAWSIEALLPRLRCPVLAIQGEDDAYGTMAQIDGIAARVPQAQLLKLPACGHSPHRDQPGEVISATQAFLSTIGR